MPSVSDSEERKVESGAEAFRQARYADTVALLTPAARHGNARAQFILALVFQVGGIGVNKDFEKSKMWYRKSAKNGDADAQFRLYNWPGLENDPKQRLIWLKKSADQGFANAIVALASYYKQNSQIPNNLDMAYQRWHQLAVNGNIEAQSQLAEICIGRGDMIHGLMWLDLATNYPRGLISEYDQEPQQQKRRNIIAKVMSGSEVAKADNLAEDFRRKHNLPIYFDK